MGNTSSTAVSGASGEPVAFLGSRGIGLAPKELDRLLVEAIASLQQTLYRPDPRRDLTRAETQALERAGFDLEPRDLGADDPLARSAALFAALIKTSLSPRRVAALLGVAPSSIRRRLAADPPRLYGIRLGSGWHVPTFQIDEDRLLPGLGEVIAQLDRELHPVAVYRWFTTPNPDLIPDPESDHFLSPRDWLRLGFAPGKVAQLAADL